MTTEIARESGRMRRQLKQKNIDATVKNDRHPSTHPQSNEPTKSKSRTIKKPTNDVGRYLTTENGHFIGLSPREGMAATGDDDPSYCSQSTVVGDDNVRWDAFNGRRNVAVEFITVVINISGCCPLRDLVNRRSTAGIIDTTLWVGQIIGQAEP